MPIDDNKVEELLKRAQREIDEGLLPSCQLALAIDGEVVVNEAFGDATTDSRYVIFSATKPTVAAACWLLIDAGELDVSRTVASYIPEFGTNGKEGITVEQVMLHTSGFPHAPMGAPAWWTREGRLERFGQWRLNWEPGTRYEYHATSAHWVLAELIERLNGRDYRDVVNEKVLGAMGLTKLRVGVPAEDQGDVVDLVQVGEPMTAEETKAAFGVEALPETEVTDEALMNFNRADVRALGVPGGGGISTAADLARFYQHLLHDPNGLFSRDLLADVTGKVRNHLPDPLMGTPAERTLGLVTAGDDGKSHFRGMGRTVSPRAFGHNGAAGQIAWADPATGLSFAYLTNGIDAHMIRMGRRGVALASLAGACASPA